MKSLDRLRLYLKDDAKLCLKQFYYGAIASLPVCCEFHPRNLWYLQFRKNCLRSNNKKLLNWGQFLQPIALVQQFGIILARNRENQWGIDRRIDLDAVCHSPGSVGISKKMYQSMLLNLVKIHKFMH